MSGLPRVAITVGDVAGVGPELVARAGSTVEIHQVCRPLVVGHPAVLRRALELVGSTVEIREVNSPLELEDTGPERLDCWNPGGDAAADVAPRRLDARAGRAAYDYLMAATDAALRGEVDAITTAPLNKEALHLGGLDYPGHTEILAERCGVEHYAMMLHLRRSPWLRGAWGLSIAHTTLHTSIASVPGLLSTAAIREKIFLMDAFLRRIGCASPRVAVCALNPHGGENGLFGDEEGRLIEPAVEEARARGVQATGPLPADTLFRRAVHGEFDGVVAMYHDQGHIAMKLIGFDEAVNITLGLPIVRTSPSHGTAFDIAWTGQARTDGLSEAIRVAARLAESSPLATETDAASAG